MKLTLVRHAEVEEAYKGKYNGHIDIGLSPRGYEQAKELALKLQDKKFDAIYCSDLLRAKETLKAFHLSQEVIYTKKLREKSWGKHEGKSFEEIEKSGIKYENFEQWIEALDGEKVDDFRERIRSIFYEDIVKSSAKNILVVTHSGVIKMFMSLYEHISLEEAFSQKLDYTEYLDLVLI